MDSLNDRLEQLKLQLLDDRDRFLLSDSNTWQDPSKLKEQKAFSGLPTKLPATHRLIHRKGNWGRNMKDQLAVRALDELGDGEEPIMTTPH